MLVKIAILFLLGMVLIAMIGRALFPGTFRVPAPRAAAPCPACGRHVIDKGPCPCGARKKA